MLLENEKVKLRALEPEDLECFYKWENDAAYWSQSNTLGPYSRYELKRHILASKNIYESRQLHLLIEKKPERIAVGMINLYDFDPHSRRAAVGIIVDRAHQKDGMATNALSLLCEYAFSFLKLHQLYAYISVKNDPSKKLFAHCGFEERGVLPGWQQTIDGYEDVLLVSLIPDLSGN